MWAACGECSGTSGAHKPTCSQYAPLVDVGPRPSMPTARSMADQLRSDPNITPALLVQAAAIIDTLCDVIERG